MNRIVERGAENPVGALLASHLDGKFFVGEDVKLFEAATLKPRGFTRVHIGIPREAIPFSKVFPKDMLSFLKISTRSRLAQAGGHIDNSEIAALLYDISNEEWDAFRRGKHRYLEAEIEVANFSRRPIVMGIDSGLCAFYTPIAAKKLEGHALYRAVEEGLIRLESGWPIGWQWMSKGSRGRIENMNGVHMRTVGEPLSINGEEEGPYYLDTAVTNYRAHHEPHYKTATPTEEDRLMISTTLALGLKPGIYAEIQESVPNENTDQDDLHLNSLLLKPTSPYWRIKTEVIGRTDDFRAKGVNCIFYADQNIYNSLLNSE